MDRYTDKSREELLDEIDQLVSALVSLAQEYNSWRAAHTGLEQLATQWHFTVSQQHQLAELARRWKVLIPDQPLWLSELGKKKNAAAVLQSLQQHLDALPPSLVQKTHNSRV